jgi:hypothetical protein
MIPTTMSATASPPPHGPQLRWEARSSIIPGRQPPPGKVVSNNTDTPVTVVVRDQFSGWNVRQARLPVGGC